MVNDMNIWITGKIVHVECENEKEARGLAKGIALAQDFMKQAIKKNGD